MNSIRVGEVTESFVSPPLPAQDTVAEGTKHDLTQDSISLSGVAIIGFRKVFV